MSSQPLLVKLRLTPESISSLQSLMSKSEWIVLAQLSDRAQIIFEVGEVFCVFLVNPNLDYYLTLEALLNVLIQMHKASLQVNYDDICEFMRTNDMKLKKTNQTPSTPQDFRKHSGADVLVATLSESLNNSGIVGVITFLGNTALKYDWYTADQQVEFIGELIKVVMNNKSATLQVLAIIEKFVQHSQIERIKSNPVLRALAGLDVGVDKPATNTALNASSVDAKSCFPNTPISTPTRPIVENVLASTKPKQDQAASRPTSEPIEQAPSKGGEEISEKPDTYKFGNTDVKNSRVAHLNLKESSRSTHPEVINGQDKRETTRNSKYTPESERSQSEKGGPRITPNVADSSSRSSNKLLTDGVNDLVTILLKFCESPTEGGQEGSGFCGYNDLMDDLVKFSKGLDTFGSQTAFFLLINIYWGVDAELFYKALFNEVSNNTKLYCSHRDNSPSCPSKRVNSSSVKRYLFDRLVSNVAFDLPPCSWFALAGFQGNCNEEGYRVLSELIWKIRPNFRLVGAITDATYQLVNAAEKPKEANPINLAFVHQMFGDVKVSLEILEKYSEKFADNFNLTTYLENFYREMKKIYNKPEDWRPICQEMIKTANFACQRYERNLELTNYIAALDKFIDDSEVSQEERQSSRAGHYISMVSNPSLPQSDQERILQTILDSLEKNSNKTFLNGVFDKFASLFTDKKETTFTQGVLAYVNKIAANFDEEVLQRSQNNSLAQITLILKHFSRNQIAAVKKCFNNLYNAFRTFSQGLFDQTIRYTTFFQIEVLNLKSSLWEFIHSTCSEINAANAGRDGTVKMPEDWTLANLEKSFARMSDNCQKFEPTKKIISDIIQEKKLFEQLDATVLQKSLSLLNDEPNLTVQDIAEICASMQEVQHMTRAIRLQKMPLYLETLKKSLLAKYFFSPISYNLFDKACFEAEDTVSKSIALWSNVMSSDIIIAVTKNINWIQGEEKSILLQYSLVDESSIVSILQSVDLVRVLYHLKSVSGCLTSLDEFLNHEKKLKESQKPQATSLIAKLQEANQLFAKGSLMLCQIEFTAAELKVLHLIGNDVKQLECLAELTDLVKYFSTKSSRHFQDMYTDLNPGLKIAPADIDFVQEINEAYKKDIFESFVSFLEVFMSENFRKMKRLSEIKQKLMDASKDLMRDSSDKVIQMAEKVLGGSSIVFYPSKVEYSTFCVFEPDIGKAIDLIKRRSTITGDHLLTKQELVDSKIKLSMLRHAKKRKDAELIQKILDVFLPLVDSIEQICDSLNEIARSGTISNFGEAINTYISSSANNHKVQGHLNSLWRVENRVIVISACSAEKPNKSEISEIEKEERILRHLEIIKDAFSAMLKDMEEGMLNFKPKNHLLLMFDTFQKMKLCEYVAKVAKGTKLKDEQNDHFTGLLNYMTGELDNNETSLAYLKQSVNKNQQPTGYTMEEELSGVLISLFKKSKIPIPKVGARLGRIQVFGAVFANDKFSRLLDLFNMFNITKFMPWQFFIASPATTTEALRLFLMRAFFDPYNRHYFALDLHLLSDKCAADLVMLVKKHVDFSGLQSLNMNLILMLSKVGSGAYLYTNLLSRENLFEPIKDNQLRQAATLQDKNFKNLTKRISALMVDSDLSGMGKSHYIERDANNNNTKLRTIILAGDTSKETLERRFDIIADLLKEPGSNFSLHIKLDMMDNMQRSTEIIDQILFNITFLRCLPFRDGYVFFDYVVKFYVEVQNSYRELLLNHVSMLSLFDRKCICPDNSSESLADRLHLPRLSTFKFHDGTEKTTVEVLCIFLLSMHFHIVGKASLTTAYEALVVGKHFTGQSRQLIRLLEHATNKRIPSQFTYAQLVNFLKIVTSQAVQMDLIPALDPNFYRNDPSAQHFLRNLESLRETASKMIIRLANELIWGVSSDIREETKETIKAMGYKGEHHAISSEDLERFRNRINGLKKWEHTNTLNIFFYEGAMKIIYRSKKDLPKELHNLILQATGQNEVLDFATLNQNGLLKELTEALNLTTTLNIEKEYLPILRDNAARLQKFIQMQVEGFRGKGYIITLDNYLKILIIVQRADLQIPIVIMGATGCGKTYMMEFICKSLLQEEFECITLHPGVQEIDLLKSLAKAAERAASDPKGRRHWVLFDEFNTSPLQCLIAEIMTDRRSSSAKDISSQRFPDNLVFVAACNPFRINAATTKVGLVHESSASILSHRVYPIPDTLINNIWDFGQLSPDTERQYIECMLASSSSFSDGSYRSLLAKAISECQGYLRGIGSDNSVSLRDVSRFIILYSYFEKLLGGKACLESLIIVIHLCYFCRLDNDEAKKGLYTKLNVLFRDKVNFNDQFDKILSAFSQEIVNTKKLPHSITLNRPLLENLLATVTCMANKIPIIICGKPGTSKTLSASICNILFDMPQELKKTSLFFRDLPQIVYVNFWGSLTTTSEAVERSFRDANDKAQELENKLVCLVFDEIGLAEVSPHNPLKVLHPLLEPANPKIAFLGLSNWRLDQSKMNRVIYVARPDMNSDELFATCKFQEVTNPRLRKTAETSAKALATAFHDMRKRVLTERANEHPDFHGSRDFYEAINIFKRSLAMLEDEAKGPSFEEGGRPTEQIVEAFMINAIQRCFGGKLIQGTRSEQVMINSYIKNRGVNIFGRNLQDVTDRLSSATELIYQNLIDPACRHLLILTESNVIEELLVTAVKEFETRIRGKSPGQIEYMSYTEGREDLPSIFLSRLPIFVTQGYTIILKNLDQVYGSMYDLLNLNYSEQDDTKTCDLFYGNHKEPLIVHDEFKCIIFMRRQDTLAKTWEIEKKQPPPFLNRFEKYLIQEKDIIPLEKQKLLDSLITTYLKVPAPEDEDQPSISQFYLVHNLSKELMMSVALQDCKLITEQLGFDDHSPAGNNKIELLRKSVKKLLPPDEEEQVIAEAFSRQPIVRPVAPRSKPPKEAEQSEAIQSTEQLLMQMSSHNMVILESIRSHGKNSNSNFSALKKLFLDTHPYDSLIDLIINLRKQSLEKRRAIVFTWTSAWELRGLAESCSEFILIDCSPIYIKDILSRETVLRDLLANADKAVVFQFSSKQDWKLIRHVRFYIEDLAEVHKCPIVIVAQVQPEDLANKVEQDSSINYFNKNWQMWVIDNLMGCQYQELFDQLEQPCVEFLTSKERSGEPNLLLEEINQEGLNKALLPMLESGDTRKMKRGLQCAKIIQENTSILAKLKEVLLSRDFARKDLRKILDESMLAECIVQTFDVSRIFSTVIKRHFEELVVKALKHIDKKISLELFYLSSLFSKDSRDRLIQSMEVALNMRKTPENSIEPSEDKDRFSKLPKIGFNYNEYKRFYKPEITDLFELKVQGISDIKSRLQKLYQKEPPTSMFTRIPQFSSTEEEKLAALFIFDKHLEKTHGSMWNDSLILLIVRMVDIFIPMPENEKHTLRMQNFVTLMLALCELFESEFKLLLGHAEILSDDDIQVLTEAMLKSFAKTGTLDISVLAQSLNQISEIENRASLLKMIQNFKLVESFKCETDKLDQITPGETMMVRILELFSSLSQSEFENARRVYNSMLSRKFVSFEYLSILVLYSLIYQKEIEPKLVRNFVLSLSGQLFDVCLGQDQPLELIKGVIKMLILLVDGNVMEVLKRSLAMIVKIVCSLYLRSLKDKPYKEAVKMLTTLLANTNPSTQRLDIHSKALTVRFFNEATVREFDSIIEAEDVQIKKERNATLLETIQHFYDAVMPVITNTSNTSSTSIIELQFVDSVAWLKYDLLQLKKDPYKLGAAEATTIDELLHKLMEPKSGEGSNAHMALCLLLMTQLFGIFNSTTKLRQAHLTWLARLIDSWSASSQNDFVLPSRTLFKQIQTIKNLQLEFGAQASPSLVEQMSGNSAYRFDALNMIFRAGTMDDDMVTERANQFSRLPEFRDFMRNALRAFQKPEGKTGPRRRVNFQESSSARELCEDPEAVQPGSGRQHRTFIIGAILNLQLTLPQQNPLSWVSTTSTNKRPVLINYPSAALQRLMPVVAFYQQSHAPTRPQTNQFTTLYQCQTPGCGTYVPVGDCGQLNGNGICMGCKAPIGGGIGRPNLVPVDIRQIIQQAEVMKTNEDKQYNAIPQDNRDNSWIIEKYGSHINTPVAAMIIKIFQSVLNFLFDSKEFGFAERQANTLLHILDSDLSALQALIEKDEETTFTYLALVIWNITYQNIKQPMATVDEVRAYVGSKYGNAGAVINTLVTNYQKKRAELLQAAVSTQDTYLALVKGNLNQTAISQFFKDERLTDLWRMMQKKEVFSFEALVEQLEKLLPEPKSGQPVSQDQKKAGFILDILEIEDLIRNLLRAIEAIRRFLLYLANKFDTRFTEQEAMSITIGELIERERLEASQNLQKPDSTIAPSTKSNRQVDKHLSKKPAREEGELAHEYRSFSEIWNELVIPMIVRHETRIKLKFECEQIGQAINILHNLCRDDTPLISFLCVQTRSKEPKAVVMRALLEGLTTLQNDLIDKFSSLADIGESAVSKIKINAFKAPKNAFIRLTSNLRQDLQTHSRPVIVTGHDVSQIVIDIGYLATKYAQEIFRGAMILKVESMFHFSDDDDRRIERLLGKLESKVKQTDPLKACKKIMKSLEWLTPKDLSERVKLQRNLQLIIVELLGVDSPKQTDTIEKVLPKLMQQQIANSQLSKTPVCHLKLVVWKLYEQAYSEALKKAKTLQKPESDKNEKSKIPPQRGLQGLKLEQDDREKWVWLLKSAYSKAVLDATEGSSPLEEPLRDAVDEEWEKQIDQFKTAAGLAPEQSLTFGDVPQLISLLSSSKN